MDVNKQLLDALKKLLEMDMRGQELQCLMEHSDHGVDLLEECNAAIAAAEQSQQAQQAEPEPFGYFMAAPFGWTDCEKDDEGAIALYERPQPEPVARDVLMAAMRAAVAECAEICDVYSSYKGARCASEIRHPIMNSKLADIADRYAAQPPAAAVPDGYALVPVEPTREMLDAAVIAGDEPGSDYYTIYSAMLAAAQKGGE